MFAFSQVEPNLLGTVRQWDIPINTWMGLKFSAAQEFTGGEALERMVEDANAQGPLLPPETLNMQYSIPGDNGLVFKEPISEGRAQLMHQRKRRELERLAYFEAASHSWLSMKAAAGLGASVVGSVWHPVDMAASFIPLFGQAKRAEALAAVGASAFRQRLARGLIATEEGLARARIPFPRLTASALEGAAGNAIVEVPVFFQAAKDQAIYGFEDSLLNIAAGGAFAGTVRALGIGLRRGMELYLGLDERVREVVENKSKHDFLNDQPISVDKIVNIDEAAIRQSSGVRFDVERATAEAEAKVAATEAPAQGAEQSGAFRIVTELQAQDLPPNAHVGTQDWRKSFNEAPDIERKIDWLRAVANNRGAKATAQDLSDVLRLTEQLLSQQEHSRLSNVLWDVARNPAASQATRERALELYGGSPVVSEIERRRRVNELVEEARKEWNEDERFKKAVAEETARQQAEGKILSTEQVDRLSRKEIPDETDLAAVKEDVTTLHQELTADPERPLTEAQQDGLDELVSHEKAVDAALPCILRALTKPE